MLFELRQRLAVKGRRYRERTPFDAYRPISARADDLFRKYRLERWRKLWNRQMLQSVIGTLDLLDRIPERSFREVLTGIDVGAREWGYVGALRSFLEQRGVRSVKISGIELDAFPLYFDLTSRLSYASYMTTTVSDQNFQFFYRTMDVRNWREVVDLVFWFFPYMIQSTHLAAGIPKKYFQPEETFFHVVDRLNPGGVLVIANQGPWEWEVVEKYLSRISNLQVLFQETVEGSLHPSLYPIVLTVFEKVRV